MDHVVSSHGSPINPDSALSDGFYDSLLSTTDFVSLADAKSYSSLPEDWVVLVTDIVSSKSEIEKGRYKTINLVGASVIAAVKNAVQEEAFPFVFGGDGASLAVPNKYFDLVNDVAARIRRWALDEFQIEIRVGIALVSEIQAAGFQVRVARFGASDSVDFAVFSGGGVKWLERQIKTGAMSIPMAAVGDHPDLNGLSCRWSNIKAKNGNIVSLVVEPSNMGSDDEFFETAKAIISKTDEAIDSGSPIPAEGPSVEYPPPGMGIEARASRAGKSYWVRYIELCVENLFAWVLFRLGWVVGGFDPKHYRRQTGLNTDHRKFEDGLKMTFDCDDATLDWVRKFLDDAKIAGKIKYGISIQSEAFLTCIVIAPTKDDHVHFVDGASGGYSAASKMLSL